MWPPLTLNGSSKGRHRRKAFPRERRLVLDTLQMGRRRPMMHGLLEVDVTAPRRLMREHREQTGESLSFTAFVLACVGKAVAAHPEVHAVRDWLGRLVMFEDVDVTTIVEVDVEGRRFGLARVVRDANRRSFRDIHNEIRSVQSAGSMPRGLRWAAKGMLFAPGPLRRGIFRFLLCFPRFRKQHTGTVLLTAVGMFGGGAGWGFSAPGIHGLSIVVGGIASRNGRGEDDPLGREVLYLTVSADHELIDGAPLARFIRDLRELIEGGDGVRDAVAVPGTSGATS
jgi:pyruvate/2-oxoglutarate dehydrogenase complex dihydrolipoamide acyltransferase (E2) component